MLLSFPRFINYLVVLLTVISLPVSFAAETNIGQLPNLPEPVTNNAVSLVTVGADNYLVSFMGLGESKTFKQVHNKVWALKLGNEQWKEMSPVPSSLALTGRLASVAVPIASKIYLFGGYTVAGDHTEISSQDNFVYDVVKDQYLKIQPMPVSVDDAVALTYDQKYIYLISGWHNDGNVNLVQIYDVEKDSWQQASPFLGKPVFGHAGGIVGNQMIICDGVAVIANATKRRSFKANPACYFGTIDKTNPVKIDWRIISHPTGKARYRMAATGIQINNQIVFAGGSENPYNYDGIGYDGKPSEPKGKIWIYDLSFRIWSLQDSKLKTMDHRGLIELNGRVLVIGGMGRNQRVLNSISEYKLKQK